MHDTPSNPQPGVVLQVRGLVSTDVAVQVPPYRPMR